jgi:hypothetical protein
LYKFELGIIKLAQKECLAPTLETSKTADMEKNDIPIIQIDGEVKVVGEDRLQSNFQGQFSTLTFFLLAIFPHKILSFEFIFVVKVVPTHKRTEGRAPVWGSEFTSKRRRTTGGDPAETAVG